MSKYAPITEWAYGELAAYDDRKRIANSGQYESVLVEEDRSVRPARFRLVARGKVAP